MPSPDMARLVSITRGCGVPMNICLSQAGLIADGLWLVQGEALVEELTLAQRQAADHAAQLATVQQQRAAEQLQLAEAHEALDAALMQLEELSHDAQVHSMFFSVRCALSQCWYRRVRNLHECFAFTSIAGPRLAQISGSEHLLG